MNLVIEALERQLAKEEIKISKGDKMMNEQYAQEIREALHVLRFFVTLGNFIKADNI